MRSSILATVGALLASGYPAAGRLSKPLPPVLSNSGTRRIMPTGFQHGPDDWGRSPQCRRMVRANRLRRAGLGGDKI